MLIPAASTSDLATISSRRSFNWVYDSEGELILGTTADEAGPHQCPGFAMRPSEYSVIIPQDGNDVFSPAAEGSRADGSVKPEVYYGEGPFDPPSSDEEEEELLEKNRRREDVSDVEDTGLRVGMGHTVRTRLFTEVFMADVISEILVLALPCVQFVGSHYSCCYHRTFCGILIPWNLLPYSRH